MSHLLAMSIGPVQEFIAAARRTADLQAGSDLLSGTAQAAAQALEQQGALPIFPSSADQAAANKILVELPSGSPETAATAAEESARNFLRSEWKKAAAIIPAGVVISGAAEAQVDSFLEIYTAWSACDGAPDYPRARHDVEGLLAGRKALRDFSPPPGTPGQPMSPLDPAYDCVLRLTNGLTPASCRTGRLRLKPRETLDALSLIKRVRGRGTRVPSTSLMAARCILPQAQRACPGVVQKLVEMSRRTDGAIDLGDLMFPDRLTANEIQELGLDPSHITAARGELLSSVGQSETPPYYAVLAADGDRMGQLISHQKTRDEHRDLSASLGEFAGWAKHAVETERDGKLIYAGGDDVLALLPLNQAIGCAGLLAAQFREAMGPFAGTEGGGTLSVGVAIVHHLESLQTAVERAREAEHAAKQSRNAIAVALHKRGGAPLIATLRWDTNPDQEWEGWISSFRGDLARGAPYELQILGREWKAAGLESGWLRKEAERILNRKQGGGKVVLLDRVRNAVDLESLADLMVIARFFAAYPEAQHG